jgi:hypothetical protein
MLGRSNKKVTVEVSNDTWKKLKILSLQKDITLHQVAKDILDRAVSKKNLLEVEENT